jgi:hypothetical protein
VSRRDYAFALRRSGRAHDRAHDATVTPRYSRGWLSGFVRWTRLEHLTLSWWFRHVVQGCEAVETDDDHSE